MAYSGYKEHNAVTPSLVFFNPPDCCLSGQNYNPDFVHFVKNLVHFVVKYSK